jgi:hypothetical protein
MIRWQLLRVLVACALLVTGCTGPVTPNPGPLGARRAPGPNLREGCAEQTARDLETFEEALAEGWRSYETLCGIVGPPDWETGSGLQILIYELGDGSEVQLRYAGAELVGAEWQREDLVVDLLVGEE